MRARFRLGLWIVLALVTLGACGGGDDGGDGDATGTGGEKDVELDDVMTKVPSRLSVKVEGNVSFSFEGDVELLTTLINTEATPLRFLSVGMERMQVLDDGTAFRVAFDFPGEFDGAGTYELSAAGGSQTVPSVDPDNPDPNTAVAGLDRAFIVFNPKGSADDDPSLLQYQKSFEVIVKPCRLEVEDEQAEAGRLVCPELAHSSGDTVSLDMRWEKR